MRRLTLLLLSLLSLAGLAGVAHATSHARSSGAPAAALPRQDDAPYVDPDDLDGDGVANAQDKCPAQAGSEQAAGCPDADKDGVPDTTDKCPTERAASADGCFNLHLGFNGYLPKVSFAANTGQDQPVVDGTAVVEVSRSVADKLRLSSTRIGSADFTQHCGHGVLCAVLKPSAVIVKRLEAAKKRLGDDGSRPVYVQVKVSFEMTKPRKETLTDTYRFGLDANGGQYRVCGAGFTAAQYHGVYCGGKSSGGDEG